MKKILYLPFVLILSLSFLLTSCGQKSSDNNSKPPAIVRSIKSITSPKTKEFSYLPAYSKDIQATKYFAPSNNNSNTGIALYTIKNTTSDTVYKNYKKIFQDTDWDITQDVPDHSITATDNTHTATIIIQQSGSDVKLTVTSK